MNPTIRGISPDAPTVTNEAGGKQSHVPYRCDLLPPQATLAVASVLASGAAKYGEDNWHAIESRDHLNHALTHVLAWLAGDRQDDHLGHAACRVLMALDQELSGREIVTVAIPSGDVQVVGEKADFCPHWNRRSLCRDCRAGSGRTTSGRAEPLEVSWCTSCQSECVVRSGECTGCGSRAESARRTARGPTSKPRIYIAGPISKGNLRANIRQADDAFFELLRAGFAPLCPHWSCFAGGTFQCNGQAVYAMANATPRGTTHEDWVGADMPWVEVADAVIRLPGESDGADRETKRADELGIPVFYSVQEAIEWKTGCTADTAAGPA